MLKGYFKKIPSDAKILQGSFFFADILQLNSKRAGLCN
jgi:hypothetical protein